jgi:hypothetical protein
MGVGAFTGQAAPVAYDADFQFPERLRRQKLRIPFRQTGKAKASNAIRAEPLTAPARPAPNAGWHSHHRWAKGQWIPIERPPSILGIPTPQGSRLVLMTRRGVRPTCDLRLRHGWGIGGKKSRCSQCQHCWLLVHDRPWGRRCDLCTPGRSPLLALAGRRIALDRASVEGDPRSAGGVTRSGSGRWTPGT